MSYYDNDVLIDGAHNHTRRYIRRPAFFLSLVPVQSATIPIAPAKQQQQRRVVVPTPAPVPVARKPVPEPKVAEPVEAEAPVPHDHLRADSTSSTASVESTKKFLKLGPNWSGNNGEDDYAVEG